MKEDARGLGISWEVYAKGLEARVDELLALNKADAVLAQRARAALEVLEEELRKGATLVPLWTLLRILRGQQPASGREGE